MSEEQTQENQGQQEQRKLKDPRDLKKRPPSRAAKSAPDHVRAGQHGIRTTATDDPEEVGSLITELQRENFKLAEQEDYEASSTRTTGAGPNPYRLKTSREVAGDSEIEKALSARDENELDNSLLSERAIASFVASSAESNAADAEVQTLGATVTDTGQKIVLKPDRVDAQDRAVLERKDHTHAEAIKEYEENAAEEGLGSVDYRVAAAHAEAIEEAGEDEMTADKNPGAVYGGNVQEQSS